MSQSKFKPVQLSMFDPIYNLSPRQLRKLTDGWPGMFNQIILPELIELEDLFAPLYSSSPNSRPSTPTYLVLGMLVLKAMHGLTDEELEFRIEFSIDFQYALGTTSFERQPVNQRTLNRFRAANAFYTEQTGIDLMTQFVEKLSKIQRAEFLGTNLKRRMDSVMIDNGCRKLSRLQLAHVVIKNVLLVLDENEIAIPEVLHHYIEDFDENVVIYHSRISGKEKLETACRDACIVVQLFPEKLKDCEEYQQLCRFLSEQVVRNEDGTFETVRDGKKLSSTTMNNPAEPESTVRQKAGKTHQGYVGNFVETVDLDTNRKIIDSIDFRQNIYSDSQFAKDEIHKMAQNGDTAPVTADGAYMSAQNVQLAADNGIRLTGTSMTGRKTPDLMAGFEIDEKNRRIVCPHGKAADRVRYDQSADNWHVSYIMDKTCKECPYHETNECPLKRNKRVRSGNVSKTQIARAKMQQMRGDEYEQNYRFRNGVEAIPSQLRRDQNIDKMPFRGLLRKKQGYGLAVAAINARRVIRYAKEDAKKGFDLCMHQLKGLIFVKNKILSQINKTCMQKVSV